MEVSNEKDTIKLQFSKNAEKYVQSKSHGDPKQLSQLIEWIKPSTHSIALDIATGGGHVARTLAPHVSQVTATDITKEMLANTARHLQQGSSNIFYVVADAESLPFLDKTFDIITCRIAAHHFPNPALFIQEVSRVLKDNGQFVLVDNVAPNNEQLASFMNQFEKLRDRSHGRCLPIKEWEHLFLDANLIVEKSELREKTYDFKTWVKRTTDSEGEGIIVEEFLLNASEEPLDYFQIQEKQGKVQSLQVDEWIVLCKKANNSL